MSISTSTHKVCSSSSPRSTKIINLIRQFTSTMKTSRRKKPTQVHALTINSILSSSSSSSNNEETTSFHFINLKPHLIEPPPINSHFTPVDFIDSISNLYNRISYSKTEFEICGLYLEQYGVMCGLGDSKLGRRCLQSVREHAVDSHSKVVSSAWLRYERREDELVGVSALDCIGKILECPKSALVDDRVKRSCSVFDCCQCVCDNASENENFEISPNKDSNECLVNDDDEVVDFCIGNEVISCNRRKIGLLSSPLNTLLYGSFVESEKEKIDFSRIGISVEAMRGVELFSRMKKLLPFSPPSIVLEILSFSQKFCCEEMKLECEVYLSSLVSNVDDALVFIEYAFEESSSLLVASCLQVLLRELPSSLNNQKVVNLFCNPESFEKLRTVNHTSFLLYYFLTQVSIEEKMTSANVVSLFERLIECATEKWQKTVAFHQLGVLLFEREEYKDAKSYFEVAFEMGHVYSAAGIARTMYKQGKTYLARDLINKIISECKKPNGWMYQERSLYTLGSKKLQDLDEATKLDPTLTYPYKYRSVLMVTDNPINEANKAIQEINKIIRFKVTPDCLELRAWFYLILEDYQSAVTDIRVLLSLDPNYMVFHGKMRGDYLVEVLSQRVERWSSADCWLQLYDRWSCIDDIGSLAIIHQMMYQDPGKSVLRFRQSLLLLRLNCQKAAMRSLRLARNLSTTKHERLVYEGWILYDTGYREEALSKAEESISIQRSFEAYFLKAYTLADASLDSDSSSFVIQLLIDALKCPSDGLRKGQALNNLGSIYVDCGKHDLAADCYINALDIKHTRAHQGLARVYALKGERKAAYDEMTKLIEIAQNSASAYEKRSEYCDRETATSDLSMATQLDPLRTYPYRYRAAVLMDEQKETEAVEELTKAIAFKPELQMLHLRAAFYESMSDYTLALRDCEAALCLDPNHKETLELYIRTQIQCAKYTQVS